VVERAKRFAARHETSVSEMVESFLTLATKSTEHLDSPIVHSLRGSLKQGTEQDYKDHLIEKYLGKKPAAKNRR
jgi:hypothetical protein